MDTAYQLYIQWAAALMRASPVLRERGLKQDCESGGHRNGGYVWSYGLCVCMATVNLAQLLQQIMFELLTCTKSPRIAHVQF
jgi:hypothetical protein